MYQHVLTSWQALEINEKQILPLCESNSLFSHIKKKRIQKYIIQDWVTANIIQHSSQEDKHKKS